MNAGVSKEKSGEIPLYALGFFCFVSLIFCNTRLTVSKKPPLDTTPDPEIPNGWAVWKFKKADVCGLFLKAAISVSSPVVSLVSTSLLLVGTVKKNLYLFLPWLVLAFKGIFVVQSLNLLDLFQSFLELEMGENGWKGYFLYFLVIAFDMAECFFLREILKMFQELWVIRSPKNEEVEESSDEEVSSTVEN